MLDVFWYLWAFGDLPNLDRKIIQRKQRKHFWIAFGFCQDVSVIEWHKMRNNTMHGNSKALLLFDRRFSPIWLDFCGFCCYLIGLKLVGLCFCVFVGGGDGGILRSLF